jgi:hypothetical protein
VDLTGLRRHPRAAAVRAALAALEAQHLVSTHPAGAAWDLRIEAIQRREPRPASQEVETPLTGLHLRRRDGTLVPMAATMPKAEGHDDPEMPRRIANALRAEARWRLLCGLCNPERLKRVQVEVRIIRVEVEQAPDGEISYKQDRPWGPAGGGGLELRIGDYIRIEVRNTGSSGAYATLLDMRSDNTICPLWPDPKEVDSHHQGRPLLLALEDDHTGRSRNLQGGRHGRAVQFQPAPRL